MTNFSKDRPTTTRAFVIERAINLQVRITHGSVLVDTADDLAEARVTMTSDDPQLLEQLTVELQGPTLVVSQPRQGGLFDLRFFGGRKPTGIDIRVVVPTGTAVKISTFTAPITIAGQVGGADLAFGAAEATARHVGGHLRLRFGSGSARVEHVSGSVEIRSGAGNATFGEIDGGLSAGCGSGRLEVRRVGGTVRSRAGSGEARLDEVHGDVDLASGSGEISIGLPSGVSVRLDVHTGSGQVRSELPIEDHPASPTGAITVRARTGSGDVRLFRAA